MATDWVLVDPSGKHLDTGGSIFVKPDGSLTGDVDEAHLFPGEVEARTRASKLSPPNYYEPRPITDFKTIIASDIDPS